VDRPIDRGAFHDVKRTTKDIISAKVVSDGGDTAGWRITSNPDPAIDEFQTGLTRFTGWIYSETGADKGVSERVSATLFPGILSILLILSKNGFRDKTSGQQGWDG